MADFEAFPKIPRLRREAFYTEKIDGTNGAITFDLDGELVVQSRKRIISPDMDNFGFATWVHENRDDLFSVLGPGRHFGEWWGKGIQRGYDLDEKRFSLFNTSRWGWLADESERVNGPDKVPDQLHVVPILYQGTFDTDVAYFVLDNLKFNGSYAAPGFMNPEGIIAYHTAANQMFKYTIENDEEGKERGQVKAAA